MKIVCIGQNYSKHIKELSSEVPTEPVFFLKPDSALLLKNRPFYLPDFSSEIHHEIELVIRIKRLGKNIGKKFAPRYYSEIGLGVDFTARDLQRKAKDKGLPWSQCKGFDSSAPLSEFVELEELGGDIHNISFRLDINGTTVQEGNSKDMLFDIDTVVSYVSQYMTLKIGDFIFTGTPEGVGPVKIGDHLEGYINDRKLLDFFVK